MAALRELRKQLLHESVRDSDLGLHVVVEILGISIEDAKAWISLNGDPISDPISTVYLANSASINGGVILNTSLNRGDLASQDARSKLAEDVLVLLLTTLIVFGSGRADSELPN